jgi:hypothetical protein
MTASLVSICSDDPCGDDPATAGKSRRSFPRCDHTVPSCRKATRSGHLLAADSLPVWLARVWHSCSMSRGYNVRSIQWQKPSAAPHKTDEAPPHTTQSWRAAQVQGQTSCSCHSMMQKDNIWIQSKSGALLPLQRPNSVCRHTSSTHPLVLHTPGKSKASQQAAELQIAHSPAANCTLESQAAGPPRHHTANTVALPTADTSAA